MKQSGWVVACALVCACGGSDAPSNAGSGANGGVGGIGGAGGVGGSGGIGGSGGVSANGGIGGIGGSGGSGGGGGNAGSDDDAGVIGSRDNVRMNELQVAGTHNSYHVKPLIQFHASHGYSHKPLDEQLQGGVRGLELDVHQGASARETYHIAGVDPNSTCLMFRDCLATIEAWSDAHPQHTPIYVWLEIKDDTGGNPITDLLGVESDVSSVFGADDLITPGWLKGTHASPRARIDAEGWPLLDEAQGRVMFIVLNRDEHAQQYTHNFDNLDDRIMFANATVEQLDLPWVVVTKLEGDAQAAIHMAHDKNLLTATNVCGADKSDEDCTMLNMSAVEAGFHMLKDDFPFMVDGRSYVLTLPEGSPGCNAVTATTACDSDSLEP